VKTTGFAMQKKLKMNALALTLQAKYDTACTIDERFQPWQPLEGISNVNMYVRESYKQISKIGD
jgi:hypothetical protein